MRLTAKQGENPQDKWNKLKEGFVTEVIMSWFTDAEYSKYGQYIEELISKVSTFLIDVLECSPGYMDGTFHYGEVLELLWGKDKSEISITRYNGTGNEYLRFSIHRTRTGIELLPDGDIISFFAFFGISPNLNITQDQIYVISTEDGTRSKVGVSKHPEKRLKELQTGSPSKLELKFSTFTGKYKAYDIEKMIHALFDDTRTTGEWFTSTAETIIKKIKSILE